jgi:hypothetical protein
MTNLKVLQPQEVEVFYLLPALRRELAKALKEAGKSQKAIAVLLGITEAAVSQYLSDKRGAGIVMPAAFIDKVKEHAAKITDQSSCYLQLQQLVKQANDSRLLCQIHAQMDKSMTHCNVCFGGDHGI